MLTQKNWRPLSANLPAPALTALGLLLTTVFLFGGSARGDELRLLVLRPASVLAFLFCLYLIKAEAIRNNIFWTLWAISIVLLNVVHLVPLPPFVWQKLPGRELVVLVDSMLELGPVWRPLSMSPELTRNALWSSLAPLACYFLTIQLSDRDTARALCICLIFGIISGLISIVQISQGPDSIAYFYRVTNFGLGVGFFANRNHQAVMLVCLMPISIGLLHVTREARGALGQVIPPAVLEWCVALGTIFIFILVMATGSRMGLMLYVLALLLMIVFARNYNYFSFFDRTPRKRLSLLKHSLGAAGYWRAILPLVVISAVIISGRDEAFQRLASTNADEELRFSILDTLLSAIHTYLPIGSGVGTFDPVFRVHEGAEQLAPTYWNHAHNDWAELIMTGGVPAILIVAAAALWILRFLANKGARPATNAHNVAFGFIGVNIVLLTALSSTVEYPLRVPILSCLFMMSIALMSKSALRAPRQSDPVGCAQ